MQKEAYDEMPQEPHACQMPFHPEAMISAAKSKQHIGFQYYIVSEAVSIIQHNHTVVKHHKDTMTQ